MHKNSSRGFTLIELLVVIAIIGILSAVVLASLSTARQKGADAAVQSDLSTIQTQAEIYYGGTGNNTYGTGGATCVAAGSLFLDTTIANAIKGAQSSARGGTVTCSNTTSAYAVWAAINGTTTGTNNSGWCVDSTGVAKAEFAAPSAVTVCP